MTINLNFKKKVSIDSSETKKSEWRRKKILNEQTGKMVYEDSQLGKLIKKEERYKKHIGCKPGYKYDFKKEKCIKIKSVNSSPKKSITECPVGYIVNPLTKKCVKIDSVKGKRALILNYEKKKWD